SNARRVEGEAVKRLVERRRSRLPGDRHCRFPTMWYREGDQDHCINRAHVHGLNGLVEWLAKHLAGRRMQVASGCLEGHLTLHHSSQEGRGVFMDSARSARCEI